MTAGRYRACRWRRLLTQQDREQLLEDLPLAPVWMHPFLRVIAGKEANA